MLVLYQHTFIHRWAVMKAMFAYALVPFALLPIGVFTLVRLSIGRKRSWRRFGRPALGLVCALRDHFRRGHHDRAYFPMGRVIARPI